MSGEGVVEFHIRLSPGGRVSTRIADSLKVGDSAQIEGPYGSAHLRPDDDGPLVLIAGSSGLAPAKSIARTALLRQPDRRVPLYSGVCAEGPVYAERAFQVLVSRYGTLRVEIGSA